MPVKTGTAYATNVPPARLLYAAALRGSLSARADITLRNENAKTEPFHQKGSVLRITRFPARSPGGTGSIVPPGFAGNIKSGVEFLRPTPPDLYQGVTHKPYHTSQKEKVSNFYHTFSMRMNLKTCKRRSEKV